MRVAISLSPANSDSIDSLLPGFISQILQLGGNAEKPCGPRLMNPGSHPANRIRPALECDP